MRMNNGNFIQLKTTVRQYEVTVYVSENYRFCLESNLPLGLKSPFLEFKSYRSRMITKMTVISIRIAKTKMTLFIKTVLEHQNDRYPKKPPKWPFG